MSKLKGASFSLESSLPHGFPGFPMNTSAPAAAGFGVRPPFTAAQWQELEHQALIYKYLTAGVPVPPELLIPIRRSFEALPGRYWHHPAPYCSYYGKKLDPEPGRCRRTDGKKWRCSKDAHPDSKYCERHMHRGRNRSRKPVESQSQSQSASQLQSSSTTVTAASSSGAAGSGGGNLQSINPQHSVASHVNAQSLCLGGSSLTQLSMDTGPYANRYFSGVKPGVDEHSFFLETTGNARSLVLDSVDSSWCLTPSRVSSFPLLKTREPPLLQSSYPQLQSLQDNIGQVTGSSTSRQQQQHSFMSSEFGSSSEPKHESQFLRPFFDEWPKARDTWSDIEEDRSNRTSFSTTQLSMSFPMASSSDFSTTSSRSPNDD